MINLFLREMLQAQRGSRAKPAASPLFRASEMGLVNDIRGDAVDIVWAKEERAPAVPDFAVLRLEGYTGPVWSSDPRYQGCLPVSPFETSLSTTGDDTSQDSRQLSVALCWSISMYNIQGHTIDKAAIDLDKSEATARLTLFVCLSRAKRLVDLLIEPMPLEKLSKLGEKHAFHLRLREEVRLQALVEEILVCTGVRLDYLQYTFSEGYVQLWGQR